MVMTNQKHPMKARMIQSFRGLLIFNMWKALLLCYLVIQTNAQTFGTDWFYGQENNWPNDQCRSGAKQSPIDIDPSTFDLEMSVMEPLIFHGYDQTPKSARLTNIGHTIEADFTFDKSAQIMDGGLADEYKLDKIHFHWGTNGGSEHRIGSSVSNSY